MPTRLGIIGAGSMGGAILRGALGSGVLDAGEVIVVDPDDAKREAAARLGCVTSGEARFALDAEQVLIAVKPQAFRNVVASMGPVERPTVVISIMAGLSSSVIRQALGMHARVIRVMPNTPCQVGAGVSAIASGEGARDGDDALARQILGSIGEVVDVDESNMHAVTALSGSGPAYVFLLAESMSQAGVQLGLHPQVAKKLAYQTVLGAGRLLTDDAHTSAEALRAQVTSPGGTTAAALEELFEREFPQIVIDAIHAARDRGYELDAED